MNRKLFCFTFILCALIKVFAETNEIKNVQAVNIPPPLIIGFVILVKTIFYNIPFKIQVDDFNVLKSLHQTNTPKPRATVSLVCDANTLATWPDIILDQPAYLVLEVLFVGVKKCFLGATVESGGNIYRTNGTVTVSGSPYCGALNETTLQQSSQFAKNISGSF